MGWLGLESSEAPAHERRLLKIRGFEDSAPATQDLMPPNRKG
jgi:hypothetical protein